MNANYNKLSLKACTKNDLNDIWKLQETVIEGLNDKTLLRKNEITMFERCLLNGNVTLGLYDQTHLIALAILVDESGNEEDLSKDLEKHTVIRSANLKLIMVKKEYRGNHLQNALMCILEKNAYHKGYTHLCTTVSANNSYSLHNIQSMGYDYDHSAIKYGGLSREVYVKDIKKAVTEYNDSVYRFTEDDTAVFDQNHLDRYFQGNLSIASTGDIAEYMNQSTGMIHYGILIKEQDTIKIYLPEISSSVLSFEYNIQPLQLRQIWINTRY